MANLAITEKQILEKLLQMESGYVLNFSDRAIEEFFKDELGINIYAKKYNYASDSKANRMRGLWIKADNKTVAKSILKLIEYIESQILIDNFKQKDFPIERINAGKKIAEKLFGKKIEQKKSKSKVTFKNGNINITLQKEVFDYVQRLLNNGHYFNAVEEAYKIVRKKLKDITGKEKATDAFSNINYEKIFGHQAIN